ncbi:MAG: hypothetical protein K9I02_05355 [Haliscomenobacter sp.]|nr:hypothetical protein [Haliscomenobacter sp.]
MSEDESKEIFTGSFDRLIIYKDKKTGKTGQKIITYIPDLSYLRRHNNDISHNKINKLDSDFTGYLEFKKWDGTRLYILEVTNGKMTGRITFPKKKKSTEFTTKSLYQCGVEYVPIWEEDNGTQYDPETGNNETAVRMIIIGYEEVPLMCDDGLTGDDCIDFGINCDPYLTGDGCIDFGYCGDPPPPVTENPPTPPCPTTATELGNMFPNASSGNLETLKNTLNQHSGSFGIDNKEELQHFLSQAGHESAGFQNLSGEENLYYTTPERLMAVWPSRFSQTDPNKKDPDDYVRNAEKLANLVYANRMGNGDEASGDGYAYRGRGIFQLTGKDNYSDFASFYNGRFSTNHTATSAADLLSSDFVASIISALWFYKEHVLSKITVDGNTTVKSVTKLINGGLNGISDRISKMALAILNINC